MLNSRGAPDWFRSVAWLTAPVARKAKAAFLRLVLSGEEPIDKNAKREAIKCPKTDATQYPLMERCDESSRRRRGAAYKLCRLVAQK